MVPGCTVHEVWTLELRHREMLLRAAQKQRIARPRSRPARSAKDRINTLHFGWWRPLRGVSR